MNMIKIAITVILFIFSSICSAQEIEGELIFSVSVIEGAFSGQELKDTGVFYYYREAEESHYGPTVIGYKIKNGVILNSVGGGSLGSERFLEKLENIRITSFDVKNEVERTLRHLKRKNKENGTKFYLPITFDGSKYKIHYSFNNVEILYTEWNPGSTIDILSEHSIKLRNFKNIIDLFATDYGRNEFGL